MSFWHRILLPLRLRQKTNLQPYLFEEPLQTSILRLAEELGRAPNELAAELMAAGLANQLATDSLQLCWRSLSPREQDVSALACLGYTNRQMAARQRFRETVKTHLHNAMVKFCLQEGRSGMALSGWDFSARAALTCGFL
jgi:DNA-binding NarL/FixJ family response regulator